MQYLFKGSKREKLRLTNADDDNEINIYLRGRILVSMDCMWRTLEGDCSAKRALRKKKDTNFLFF